MNLSDKTIEEPIVRSRGRPRRTLDVDRKIYYREYYVMHYTPRPKDESIKTGRPLKAPEDKIQDMKAYQKAYREKRKLLKILEEV